MHAVCRICCFLISLGKWANSCSTCWLSKIQLSNYPPAKDRNTSYGIQSTYQLVTQGREHLAFRKGGGDKNRICGSLYGDTWLKGRDIAVRTGTWQQMKCQGRSTEIQNEAQRYFWMDASLLWRWRGYCMVRQTAVFTDVETQGCYWQMVWFVLSIIQASFNIIQSLHCACKTIYLHQHVRTIKCKLSINTTVLHVLLLSSSSLSHCYLLYVCCSLCCSN